MADFYPRPPRGGRRRAGGVLLLDLKFLSTPSARRATRIFSIHAKILRFLSTPSARRATSYQHYAVLLRLISIHALREEGDPRGPYLRADGAISIHALREEGDTDCGDVEWPSGVFLSTPSARRATRTSRLARPSISISIHALREEGDLRRQPRPRSALDFYPRPPRGGRLSDDLQNVADDRFLSTPSARRATIFITRQLPSLITFLSTPSARRATPHHRGRRPREAISIHALREEGDGDTLNNEEAKGYFYPRPPRGGRRRSALLWSRSGHFYPRPPRGGRPCLCRCTSPVLPISIHALREEGDR